MISSARRQRPALRRRLLASVALFAFSGGVACSAGLAHAQTPAATPRSSPDEPFNVEAQTVERSPEGVVEAKGAVEGRYRDRTLHADQLQFDKPNRIIAASGNVQIVDDLGNVEFAKSITLDQDMTAGVAVGFSARQGENKFAAATAIRHSESLNELNKAIFTPCEVCAEDGAPKAPTFSVSAEKIVQDRDRKLVWYRNATIMVKGVPILWLPVFWHADPEADRLNGLLQPRIQQTRRRGLSYEQGYLWNLSDSQDLVVSPQINTEVRPFLNLDWRKRFNTGEILARVGYTYEQDFNTRGVQFGDDRNKAFVLASGRFAPAENWTWGFQAERAQDKLLFDQYSIRNIDQSRSDIYQTKRDIALTKGIFLSDDRRLLSDIYAVRQDQRSYLSISSMSFQSLRPNLTAAPNAFGIRPFESDNTLPIVAPLVEGRFEPQSSVLGGRLRLSGGGVVLTRQDSPTTPGARGIDSSRATAEVDWRRFFTLDDGLRIEPFANGRSDYYRVNDMAPGGARTTTRSLGTLGLDVSWPLIRQVKDSTVIIEPMAQVALSPDPRLYPNIPNEDSIAFDFDDSNLFEINKSPGFDLYEGGQRLNVGVRTTVQWGEGRSAQVLVGRSFRAAVDPNFAPRTGLNDKSSDWIFAAEASPIAGLSFYTKARLEDQSLDVRRVEFGADVKLARADGYLRYLREDADFAGVPREDIEAAGEIFLTKKWGVTFDAVHDLTQSVWRRRTAGIVYRDECVRFEVIYQRQDNPVLGGRSSDAIAARVTLRGL